MSYTKGQWNVSPDGFIYAGEPEAAVEIAFVAAMSDGVPEAIDNGRLFAAAPELLESAKRKLADCRESGPCSDAALRADEYCSDECADLSRAVEKAEGRP